MVKSIFGGVFIATIVIMISVTADNELPNARAASPLLPGIRPVPQAPAKPLITRRDDDLLKLRDALGVKALGIEAGPWRAVVKGSGCTNRLIDGAREGL